MSSAIMRIEVIRIVNRDFGGCWRTGSNLSESRWMKAKRACWMLVYLAYGVFVGVRGMWHEQLGSAVIYRGKKVFVNNWAGGAYPTLADGAGWYQVGCDRREIRSVRSIGEFCHRFRACFSWWMGSWFGIAVNKRLYHQAFREASGDDQL